VSIHQIGSTPGRYCSVVMFFFAFFTTHDGDLWVQLRTKLGTKLSAINAERMNDLYEELKVQGSGTVAESKLPSIPAGCVTA
jgi:hypothetical protein